MNKNKRIPLLNYLVSRYLVTLIIGLTVIGIASVVWIKDEAIRNKLELAQYLVADVADRLVTEDGNIERIQGSSPLFNRVIEEIIQDPKRLNRLDIRSMIIIQDEDGQVVYPNFPRGLSTISPEERQLNLLQMNEVEKVEFDLLGLSYVISSPIEYEDRSIGAVAIIVPEEEFSSMGRQMDEEYRLLAILLGSLAILGLIIIYLLSNKIISPILQVSKAAKQIQDGNYNVHLATDTQGEELYDLIESFKEMTTRLKQLEVMRTELLASVTHELKTPIASISGLVQAVNDQIVSGDEKQEFLDITLNEARRLQLMVEDLLDFNSFTLGEIKVNCEQLDIYKFIQEMTDQWKMTNDEHHLIQVKVLSSKKPLFAYGDPYRMQQIIINLLNNSKHASSKEIEVKIYEPNKDFIAIDIIDSGCGIPLEEQSLIFERFYKGKVQKNTVRGLGLGLPISKLLANAQHGDLFLKESSNDGSTFTLLLPIKTTTKREEDIPKINI
ncbi:HAMP domain-containing sensor histidine kinase [Bacillus sp. SM2101]|uniref:HAMP domain-containing sensor histidine kinase n=1 Tax=Bacillaceae TaxID=186817 RepID=UPI001BDDFCF8|nr:HAMP domain-containing sensor histidine kinase [Bacillus sp. SM2101]